MDNNDDWRRLETLAAVDRAAVLCLNQTPKSRVHLQGQKAHLQADKVSPVLHPDHVYPILPPWILKWQNRCPFLEVQESELPSECSYHPGPCLHGWVGHLGHWEGGPACFAEGSEHQWLSTWIALHRFTPFLSPAVGEIVLDWAATGEPLLWNPTARLRSGLEGLALNVSSAHPVKHHKLPPMLAGPFPLSKAIKSAVACLWLPQTMGKPWPPSMCPGSN